MKPAKTPSDFVLQPAGITAHTAAGTPFCAAALSSGRACLSTGFQLADEPTFRVSAVTEQYPLTHIEAQYGKEQLSKPKYYPNLTFYYIEYQ